MADTLTSLLRLLIVATKVKDLDINDPRDALSKEYETQLASGTGSSQADLIFHDTRSLADGASEDLDLAGVLADAFGATLTFAKVKALIIKNNSATQTLSVGGASANQFVNWVGDATDIIKIAPSGFFALTGPLAGYVVTAATGDKLKVANSAGAGATYDIIIIGTSA